MSPASEPGRCPKCKARAKVVPFFARSGNRMKRLLLGLLGVFPGVAFHQSNAGRMVCDACGADRTPSPSGAPLAVGDAISSTTMGQVRVGALRTWAIAAAALGGLGVAVGLAIGGAGGIVIAVTGGLFGAGLGGALWGAGGRAAEEARRRLDAALEHAILDLAEKRGGRLTATEVARALRIGVVDADRALTTMADGSRVTVELGDEGVVYYDFREIRVSGPRVQVRVDAEARAEDETETVEVSRRDRGRAGSA